MASFDATLLDESAARGSRLVALALLDDVVHQRDGLVAKRTAESLHDFRVALRRLRSWLRLLREPLAASRPRGALKRLKRIARDSNAGRDAEVLLEWLRAIEPRIKPSRRSAIQWMVQRFERQEREAEASLKGRMARDFDKAVKRLRARLETYTVDAHVHDGLRLQTLPALLGGLARDQAAELRRRIGLVHTEDDAREVHAARIAGKRLRYLLEPVAPHVEGGEALVSQLKALQDALGDLHDAHLWLLILHEVVAEFEVQEGHRFAHALMSTDRGRVERAARRRQPARAGFVDVALLAQERAAEAFGRFRYLTQGGVGRRFFRSMKVVAAELLERGRRGFEIERKYLLSQLPAELPGDDCVRIQQGYLPGERLVERIRSVEEGKERRYFRTVKGGTGVARLELEEETTQGVFGTLWPLTDGRRVEKRRHRVRTADVTWEIDEFTDRPLVLAEVELPSADVAVAFPAWLAPYVDREVTGDPAWLNVSLAR
jgi:CHAD domain-containing protein/CYTH domain-containing protein